MYHFLLYSNQWRYKHQNWERAKPVDTFALEKVLGIIGGPEVIVVREQPGGGIVHITIKNGFIDSVTDDVTKETLNKFYAREIDL